MIPAYRCNAYLPQCLASVLSQAPGPERMQIAVVNDDPSDDACAALVNTLAPGRVEYHCNEKNLGNGGNFNRCIALARHELVLILHGDDFLKTGFFTKISALAAAHPAAGLIACRADGVDANGHIAWTSQRYREFETLSHDDSALWESLHLMPSAVVVRREVYGRIGGFREDLPNGQDWEMWSRVIRHCGIIMTPEVLATYRQHTNSISGRTRRSAQIIRDLARLYALFAALHPKYPLDKMRSGLRGMAHSQALEYERLGDRAAAAENFRAWRELTPLPMRLSTHLKRLVKKILRRPR